MLFCEIYAPDGAHPPERLADLASGLTLERLLDCYTRIQGAQGNEGRFRSNAPRLFRQVGLSRCFHAWSQWER